MTTVNKVVVREDTFLGVSAYVVNDGKKQSYYSKESFGYLAAVDQRQFVERSSNADTMLSWPLASGKKWRSTFTRENNVGYGARTIDNLMVAGEMEMIPVSGGRMDTIKIEAFEYGRGRLLAEYWFSPSAKWFAQSRVYDRDMGLVEEEILTFDVK